MRIGRRIDVVPGGPSPVGVTPRAVLSAARRPRTAAPSPVAVEVVRCGLHGRLVRRDLSGQASRTAPWRGARARAPPGEPSATYASSSLPCGSTMSSVVLPAAGGSRCSASAVTRARNSSTESGAGAPSSPSAIRPASRMVNVVRSAAGTSPSTLSTCSREAASTRSADLIASSEIWVARWSAPSAPSASAITRVLVRIGRPTGAPRPALVTRTCPAIAVGRYHPTHRSRSAAPRAERLRLPVQTTSTVNTSEAISTTLPTARPTTRALAPDKVSDRSLEGVQCAYSGSHTAPSSTSGAVASGRSRRSASTSTC